uniref:RNA-binding protein NOB1 n=1 Tax=Tetraselmis sp. GSL018 TaxID=582737 RepID=A0A061S2A5_9CHLO
MEEAKGACSGDDDDDEPPQAGAGGGEESCIVSVTADFAMQNVLLQMGLRLATPDGRRVRKMQTWVLRCSACRTVTREVHKVFCPQCGNASLDKVELTVGPDGSEQFGVRKKHNLRGTKYSLPKPRGGKNSKDPILREDVLLAKGPRPKPKAAGAEDGWATEFGSNKQPMLLVSDGVRKSIAPLLNGWKHNPNERKQRSSNRRRG